MRVSAYANFFYDPYKTDWVYLAQKQTHSGGVPVMMSAPEGGGGHGKADVVREVA